MEKGTGLMGLGYVLGGINYLVTALVFFANGDTALGLIQLVIPPAEVILPWLASPVLGLVSLASLGLIIVGANRGSKG